MGSNYTTDAQDEAKHWLSVPLSLSQPVPVYEHVSLSLLLLYKGWGERIKQTISSSDKKKEMCLLRRTQLEYCLEVSFLKRIYK